MAMARVQGSSVWRLAALAHALCAATTAASGLGVGKTVRGAQRSVFSPPPAEAPAQNWTRAKMYRITPIGDTGVANMNTADAAGDVYFGVSQLLLPYLCAEPSEGNMVWCANRKWLSGGDAWMVYREFDVLVRQPFGIYSPCNPDPKTGVFSCGPIAGGGAGWPSQCKKYEEHHHHYLAGTTYAKLPLPASHSVAGCCEQCTKDGAECDGWQLWNASGPTSNSSNDATSCALVANGSLFLNPDGIVSAASPNGNHACWYTDPVMATGFAPYCSKSQCSCKVANTLAVGLEAHAMCYGNGSSSTAAAALPPLLPGSSGSGASIFERWISGLACLMDGNWFSTQKAGECLPDGSNRETCWWRLKSSVNGTREVNASCADARVQSALRKKNPGCWDGCGGQADNVTALCPVSCLFTTIFGNGTAASPPALTKHAVVDPFVAAFAAPEKGGCPSPRGWP